jgi:hypothetical protein
LICRIDADDFNFPKRLEIQKNFLLENKGISVLGSNAIGIINSDQSTKHLIKMPKKHMDIKQLIYKSNPIIHSSVMMRKSFLHETGGYKFIGVKNVEDYYLWNLGIKQFNFFNIQEPLLELNIKKMQNWKTIMNRSIGHIIILYKNNVLLKYLIWPLINICAMILNRFK